MTQNAQALEEAHVRTLSTRLLYLGSNTITSDYFQDRQDDFAYASSRHGFTDRNTRKGMMCLGVVSHPAVPNRIWKLVRTQDDPAYIAYARWIHENRIWDVSAHAPRIYDVIDGGEVVLICMEELQEFDWENAPDYLQNDWLIGRSILRDRSHKDPEAYIKWYRYNMADTWVDLDHKNQPLRTYAEMVFDQFDGQFTWDFHKGNMMLRGEVPVISDPMCSMS